MSTPRFTCGGQAKRAQLRTTSRETSWPDQKAARHHWAYTPSSIKFARREYLSATTPSPALVHIGPDHLTYRPWDHSESQNTPAVRLEPVHVLEPSLPVQLSNSNTCAPVSDRTTLARRSWSPLEKEDGEISDEEPERFSLEGVHVSLGDWTAGPPECFDGAAELLAAHYILLGSGAIPCAHHCGHIFHREQRDLFTFEKDLSAYIVKLSTVVRVGCPRCAMYTCLVCGEMDSIIHDDGLYSPVGATAEGWGPSKATRRAVVDAYMHCRELQALIIGMGLIMIDRTYYQLDDCRVSSDPPLAEKWPKSISDGACPPVISEVSRQPDVTGVERPQPPLTPSANTPVYRALAKGRGYICVPEPSHARPLAKLPRVSHPRPGQKRSHVPSDHVLKADFGMMSHTTSYEAELDRQRAVHDQTAAVILQVLPYLPCTVRPGGPYEPDQTPHSTVLLHLQRRSSFMVDLMRTNSVAEIWNNETLHWRAFRYWQNALLGCKALRPVLQAPVNYRMRKYRGHDDTGGPMNDVWELVTDFHIIMTRYHNLLQEAGWMGPSHPAASTSPPLDMSLFTQLDPPFPLSGKLISEDQPVRTDAKEIEPDTGTLTISQDSGGPEDGPAPLVGALGPPDPPRTPVPAETRAYNEWADSTPCFQWCSLLPVARAFWMQTFTVHDLDGLVAYKQRLVAPPRPRSCGKAGIQGDIARLVRELSVPYAPHIFVRADSSRWTRMRALVVGPPKTPYENGCFIFDIQQSHLQVTPPRVRLATTNGGTYRYGPRLHMDGSVTIDVLDRSWLPRKPSLTDVLLAIRSEMLNPEPFAHVPEAPHGPGDYYSNLVRQEYAATVRHMVAADAMYNSITAPPYPFQKEIREHFRLKRECIKQQLAAWQRLEDELLASKRVAMSQSDLLPTLAESTEKVLDALDKL